MNQPKHNLPADIVFAPDWWHHHTGITFDKDFFYHPDRRVEAERRMEQELHERFGQYGLGEAHDQVRPEVGAVHLAAGFMLQEMLGCKVIYSEKAPPQVMPAGLSAPALPPGDPFASPAWKRFETLMDTLEARYGYLTGDVNWGGILNIALDLRGQDLFLDMLDVPDKVATFFADIARVIEAFTQRISARTGTSSISVTRLVRHCPGTVFLHSECSHTMISEQDYRRFLMPFDAAWSQARRPFGIHHCGNDPHRFAASYAELPHLDFLDVGWGGDVATLRQHLPNTFLSIRLDPVSLRTMPLEQVRAQIRHRVAASADPARTGLCCINMDHDMPDETVGAILENASTHEKTRASVLPGSADDHSDDQGRRLHDFPARLA